jgi:hypothetical protein
MKRTILAVLLAAGALAASPSFAGENDVTSTIPAIAATQSVAADAAGTTSAAPNYFGEQDLASTIPAAPAHQSTSVGSSKAATTAATLHAASGFGENDVNSSAN